MNYQRIHILYACRKGVVSVLLFWIVCVSCSREQTPLSSPGNGEVQITIRYASTRASDPGHLNERHIAGLDLLAFEEGVYKYRRQPYRLSEGGDDYRVTLQETLPGQTVTCYLFANCRDLINQWEANGVHEGESWSEVQQQLIDTQPIRLIRGEQAPFVPLPMWGKISGRISATAINNWGTLQLLRSVASVDLYVQKDDDSLFELTGLHLYYAPDCGFLAPCPDPLNPEIHRNISPPDMKTNLNTLQASDVETFTVTTGDKVLQYEGILYQMYCYDNDVTPTTVGPDKKFTRAIIAGYYDQNGPPEQWKKSFYPVDFVKADANMSPLVRNHKYEIWITAVLGKGYESPEEAAENYPVDLNSEVIDWNRDDVEIGVQGKYYVSLQRRHARLSRKAGSTDKIPITYRIYDDIPGTEFSVAFADDTNGTQQVIKGGIENSYFRVLVEHHLSGRTADITVIALQPYTPGNSTDAFTLRFRDLTFEITIEQLDIHESDWEWGGNQNETIE